MAISADPRAQTIKAFIRRKTTTSILIYVAFFFIFLGIVARRYAGVVYLNLGPDAELALGLGIGIGLLIITYYLWRCPACGKMLGFRFDPKACPHCKAGFTPYWKPDNERRIVTAFTRKRNARYFLYAALIVCLFFAIMLAGQYQPVPLSGMYFVLGAIVLIYGIGDMIFWRCPNCNSHLGRSWNPAACPKCNTPLRK